MDILKKYLLASVFNAPDDERGRARVVDALDDSDPDAVLDDPVDEDDEFTDDDVQEPFSDEADGSVLETVPKRRSGRPASREEQRIEALNADRRALKAEVDAANARLAALEARLSQPQQRQENPDEEAARLALMSPEERVTYRLDRGLRATRDETARMVGTIQDQTDATAFRSLVKDKPHYQRFAAEVEKEAARLRSLGTPMPREGILMFLIGKDALTRAEQPRTRAKSQQRMREQETRPAAPRGDVRGDRRTAAGNQQSAVARRLENVLI